MQALEAFLELPDAVLHKGTLGLLCNQVSYDFTGRRYLFQTLAERGSLRRCFLPEHGLFAELQDQIPLDDASPYGAAASTEFVSLYGSDESSLSAAADQLADLDALVIDVQDVGARYYTFFVSTVYLLREFAKRRPGRPVYVLDRPNPAGRQVEGTRLPAELESFVGLPGMPHRHGLTLGELCAHFKRQEAWTLELFVSRAPAPSFASGAEVFAICPSPNMPALSTAAVYAGQCLLEGTNLSEGRGTTRPFEVFGAPYLRVFAPDSAGGLPEPPGAEHLRPLSFLPAFHKYAGQVCQGWQLHPQGAHHSLLHTLALLRYVRQAYPADFRYRRGIYEFRSDRPAIEILVGDPQLLGFVEGRTNSRDLEVRLKEEEEAWIASAQPDLLYEPGPVRAPDEALRSLRSLA